MGIHGFHVGVGFFFQELVSFFLARICLQRKPVLLRRRLELILDEELVALVLVDLREIGLVASQKSQNNGWSDCSRPSHSGGGFRRFLFYPPLPDRINPALPLARFRRNSTLSATPSSPLPPVPLLF